MSSAEPAGARQWCARLAEDRRVRYLLAGGVAAVVYYTVFVAGWAATGHAVPYLGLSAVSNLITTVVTYPIYRVLVFQVGGPWVTGFLRFYVVCLGALLINFVGLPVLVEFAHLNVLVAQAIVIIGSPLINYQVGRQWAFRPGRIEESVK